MKRIQEKELKAGLNQVADQVLFTEQQEMQNLSEIHQKLRRKQMMGKGKKILIAAAAITALCATTAIGAGKIVGYYSSSSSSDSHYATAQDIKDAKEVLGVIPKAPEKFSNGLNYLKGSYHMVEGQDESGTTVTSYANVVVDYEDSIFLFIRKINAYDEYNNEEVKTDHVDGIELKVYEDAYLFLPPDVEASEEDKALEAQGKLIISYGTAEEERRTYRYTVWDEDGLNYALNTFNDSYDIDAMLQMSKEVIQSR
ncbi:MAG: hypothetical protein ACRDBO_03810 [Lachnospiraceae bacterium]